MKKILKDKTQVINNLTMNTVKNTISCPNCKESNFVKEVEKKEVGKLHFECKYCNLKFWISNYEKHD